MLSWNIAANSLGAIFVPIYNNQNDKYINHVIADSKSKLFISSQHQDSILTISDQLIECSTERKLPVVENDISTLIYTSGTTGKPKGVPLTNKNIVANIEAVERLYHDVFEAKCSTSLSILPWAHIYAMTTELYCNIFNDNIVAISSGPNKYINELREISPDYIYVVPRILQMIRAKTTKFDKPVIRIALPYIISRGDQ